VCVYCICVCVCVCVFVWDPAIDFRNSNSITHAYLSLFCRCWSPSKMGLMQALVGARTQTHAHTHTHTHTHKNTHTERQSHHAWIKKQRRHTWREPRGALQPSAKPLLFRDVLHAFMKYYMVTNMRVHFASELGFILLWFLSHTHLASRWFILSLQRGVCRPVTSGYF